MRLPKLSNPCCAMPVLEMPAAIPSFRRQSNSSPPSKRKSVNAAAPRIPNSSRKNIRLPCGISSMPSSASTPSIHGVSWRSPSRSLALAKAGSTTQTPRKNTPSQPTQANPSPASSSCASCMPDSSASLPIKTPVWIWTSLGLQLWSCSIQESVLKELKHQPALGVCGLFERRQLVLSEGRVFKWRTAAPVRSTPALQWISTGLGSSLKCCSTAASSLLESGGL